MNPDTPTPSQGTPRPKILVVDDSPIILKTISFKLKANGFDVLTAADGAEAVSTARKMKPDLILLDISFPPDVAHGGGVAWDGFLIMDWLRRSEDLKRVPIIVITGGEAEKYEQRARAAGAAAFFHKPLDHDSLIAMIRQTLDKNIGSNPSPADPSI